MATEAPPAATKDPQGRGETTRAAIVGAAEELLQERGYDGMPMREVANVRGSRWATLTTTSAPRSTWSTASMSACSETMPEPQKKPASATPLHDFLGS